MKWISVKDKLPNKWAEVIVFLKYSKKNMKIRKRVLKKDPKSVWAKNTGRVTYASFNGIHPVHKSPLWATELGGLEDDQEYVTHWMKFPKPPKNEH